MCRFFRMDFPPFEIVYLKSAKSPVHAEPKQVLMMNTVEWSPGVVAYRLGISVSVPFG